jgi:hypothetical protein
VSGVASAASEPGRTIQGVTRWRLRGSGWRDAWLPPWAELVVGCVLLIFSWEWFWETTGAVWDGWHKVVGTLATVLGPWFIWRSQRRWAPPDDLFPVFLREQLAAEHLAPREGHTAEWLLGQIGKYGIHVFPIWVDDDMNRRELEGISATESWQPDTGMPRVAAELLQADDQKPVYEALTRLYSTLNRLYAPGGPGTPPD